MNPKRRNVVVTGMGVINSISHNTKEFGAGLKAGLEGIDFLENMPEPPLSIKIGARIKEFSFDDILKEYATDMEPYVKRAKRFVKRSSFGMKTATVALLEAWQQSGLYNSDFNPEKISLVVAGSNSTTGLMYSMYDKFIKDPEYLTPSYALQFMDTDQVGNMSEILGIRGEGFTVGGASASGNVGIIKAFHQIQLGLADVCIVVGGLTDLSPMEFQGFINVGATGGKKFHSEPKKACRPFDQASEGFIYGQGSGCIILESQEFAEKRRAKILAELGGAVMNLDGNRLSNPSVVGEARAMEEAIHQAGVKPEDIDYINAHGTSTPLGDKTELEAIQRVFGEYTSDIWINSTKGLIGHCLFSAGLMEAIATILQMNNHFLHPNKNLENPIDLEMKFVPDQHVETEIKAAISNSFGFGGINTSILIKKGV